MENKDRYDLDRIIVGNQITIMRVLAMDPKLSPHYSSSLLSRVGDIKDFWRHKYNEEVGFSTVFGDSSK